jgi:hypothetical protein
MTSYVKFPKNTILSSCLKTVSSPNTLYTFFINPLQNFQPGKMGKKENEYKVTSNVPYSHDNAALQRLTSMKNTSRILINSVPFPVYF